MAQKKIHIVWQDGRTIDIRLEDNPVAEYYYNSIKHLQHVDLTFDARKNPLYAQQKTQQQIINDLLTASALVGLLVDASQLTDQKYLNELHAIYFENANQPKFDQQWLKVHDSIHLLEGFIGNAIERNTIWVDYEDKAGPLMQPFNREYLHYAITDIKAGMCFFREHELGKNPALYWKHNEPLDIETICAQSKPWLILKPVLNIAFRDENIYNTFDESKFNAWFAPVKDKWCAHWKITNWTPKEMFYKIPVGFIDNLSEIVDCFTKLDYPKRIRL